MPEYGQLNQIIKAKITPIIPLAIRNCLMRPCWANPFITLDIPLTKARTANSPVIKAAADSGLNKKCNPVANKTMPITLTEKSFSSLTMISKAICTAAPSVKTQPNSGFTAILAAAENCGMIMTNKPIIIKS